MFLLSKDDGNERGNQKRALPGSTRNSARFSSAGFLPMLDVLGGFARRLYSVVAGVTHAGRRSVV
ncbi:MAG: hypothetical protein H8D34_33435 [Chloroflexi bacterium]|nr:hypothetical protein [Chloroflexota bacterium]